MSCAPSLPKEGDDLTTSVPRHSVNRSTVCYFGDSSAYHTTVKISKGLGLASSRLFAIVVVVDAVDEKERRVATLLC